MPAAGPVRLGLYRATLEVPGGDLPFGLEIARENEKYVAYLINGTERVRVPEVTVEDGRIEMRMPGFENVLRAKIDDDELDGDLTLVKLDKEQVIDFEAKYGLKYRFFDEPSTDNADIAGRWAVVFTDQDNKKYNAVGEFRQSHDEVTGTFLTPAGDHRFLAGNVQNNEISLSAFDGAHVYLYKGKVNVKGEIEGTFWSGLKSKEKFVAKRDENATLDDAEDVTALRSDASDFTFTFPDLDGKPVSLSEPRFAGKVVIVTLGGSWCPNCHDEAAFLAPYFIQNRERGLEVVALMFEHFGDFPKAAEATKRFRDAYDVRYPVLIAGTSDKEDAAKKLPQLNGVFAFPTTLFLDRQGRIRRIHTGFSGPATGEHYQKLTEEFDAIVEQLLNETTEVDGETQEPDVPDA